MAYGYKNQNFTRSVQQNWICTGDGKESAFFVKQFAEGADAPEGASRASDNYLEAEQQNVLMNAEAGFLYNAETNTFIKAPAQEEAFPEFPAEFTQTQQAQAVTLGRRVLSGRVTREKLETRLSVAVEGGNTSDPPILNYLLGAGELWEAVNATH